LDDDDPEYWFLFPFFEEVCEETGLMIDLYDRQVFTAEHLLELLKGLDRAAMAISSKPETWRVEITADDSPRLRQIAKVHIDTTIVKLRRIVTAAYSQRAEVVCFGD